MFPIHLDLKRHGERVRYKYEKQGVLARHNAAALHRGQREKSARARRESRAWRRSFVTSTRGGARSAPGRGSAQGRHEVEGEISSRALMSERGRRRSFVTSARIGARSVQGRPTELFLFFSSRVLQTQSNVRAQTLSVTSRPASVATFSKVSVTREFKIDMLFLLMVILGCTCRARRGREEAKWNGRRRARGRGREGSRTRESRLALGSGSAPQARNGLGPSKLGSIQEPRDSAIADETRQASPKGPSPEAPNQLNGCTWRSTREMYVLKLFASFRLERLPFVDFGMAIENPPTREPSRGTLRRRPPCEPAVPGHNARPWLPGRAFVAPPSAERGESTSHVGRRHVKMRPLCQQWWQT